MTYNGEIYNFRETQKKYGYQFETSCDGEILIHLYNDKGARFMCEQLYMVFLLVYYLIQKNEKSMLVVIHSVFGLHFVSLLNVDF